MATNSVAICNSALAKIGGEEISSLSDTTRRAILCNRQYDKIRLKLLRSHPWNFAIKRSYLSKVTNISTSVNDGTDVFTATANVNFETGNRLVVTLNSGTIPGGLTDGNTYYAIKTAATTFKLATTQANAQAGTAIDITSSAAFNATFTMQTPFGDEANIFSLPSDCIRALREEEKTFINWKVEGGKLITDATEFNLVYIANISDTTLFDPLFDELLALHLAKELSYSLVQSLTLKQELEKELNELLRDTRSFDAQEGTPEDFETSTWTVSRR